ELDAVLDRLDDLGVGVPDHHHPKAVVEVDVLVAVHVPDPAALATVHEDRLRRGVLERGWDAPRHPLAGLGPELVAARTRLAEALLLGRDQVGYPAGGHVAGRGRGHVQNPPTKTRLDRSGR